MKLTPEERILIAIFGEDEGPPMSFTLRKENVAGLCDLCTRSSIMHTKDGRQNVYCERFGELDAPVETCSAYRDKRMPTLQDMEEMAFLLTNIQGRKIGFVAPHTKEHKDLLKQMGTKRPSYKMD